MNCVVKGQFVEFLLDLGEIRQRGCKRCDWKILELIEEGKFTKDNAFFYSKRLKIVEAVLHLRVR